MFVCKNLTDSGSLGDWTEKLPKFRLISPRFLATICCKQSQSDTREN